MSNVYLGSTPMTHVYAPLGGYEAAIDFSTKTVGAMPSTMDTGQAIVTTYNTTSAAQPVISNTTGGNRYTIATTANAAQAGYVTTQLANGVTKLVVDFVYQVGIHAWRDAFPSGLLTLSVEGANCHLGFSPTGWIYSVWVDGAGLQTVQSYTYSTARTNTQQQHGEVIIDPTGFATVTGDDGAAVRVPSSGTDSRINAYTCRYAQCEIYYNNASTEPRTSVWKFQATSAAGGVAGGAAPATKVYVGSNLVWTPPAAVGFVGAAASSVSSVTIPTHQVGDLMVMIALVGSTTPPTVPAGWTDVTPSGSVHSGIPASYKLAYKIATGTGDSSGTWTSAIACYVHVYRNASAIGATAVQNSTTNGSTITYPALTPTGDARSWVMAFAAATAASDVHTGNPAGYTARASQAGSISSKDTNGPVSGVQSAITQTVNNVGPWLTGRYEIRAT